jgi:hypothetical protein
VERNLKQKEASHLSEKEEEQGGEAEQEAEEEAEQEAEEEAEEEAEGGQMKRQRRQRRQRGGGTRGLIKLPQVFSQLDKWNKILVRTSQVLFLALILGSDQTMVCFFFSGGWSLGIFSEFYFEAYLGLMVLFFWAGRPRGELWFPFSTCANIFGVSGFLFSVT